jgi:hypothetical protein
VRAVSFQKSKRNLQSLPVLLAVEVIVELALRPSNPSLISRVLLQQLFDGNRIPAGRRLLSVGGLFR